jgi:hypothetical protein
MYSLELFCLVPKRKAKISFFAFVFFYKGLLRRDLIRNPRSSEEEEEIEIPKSRNSSRTLRYWAAAARRRRRRSKFPNQEIPQLTRPPCPSTKHTIHIYYRPAPQGTSSDWKNLPGTVHTDRHHCCFNI